MVLHPTINEKQITPKISNFIWSVWRIPSSLAAAMPVSAARWRGNAVSPNPGLRFPVRKVE